MGKLNCNEYRALQKRHGKPYSLGHQIMYEVPIWLMRGKKRRILEAGFGIGWGLGRMLEEGVVGSYVGYEPCKEAFDYVQEKHGKSLDVTLINEPFHGSNKPFDHVFCIEVLEHVPMEGHMAFLRALRATGGTLWMSTPDVSTSAEGVRTAGEWRDMLKMAGFGEVVVLEEQWTTFFMCQ